MELIVVIVVIIFLAILIGSLIWFFTKPSSQLSASLNADHTFSFEIELPSGSLSYPKQLVYAIEARYIIDGKHDNAVYGPLIYPLSQQAILPNGNILFSGTISIGPLYWPDTTIQPIQWGVPAGSISASDYQQLPSYTLNNQDYRPIMGLYTTYDPVREKGVLHKDFFVTNLDTFSIKFQGQTAFGAFDIPFIYFITSK